MFFDNAIHHRLSRQRLVGFVMSMAAIRNQINENIPFKDRAIFHRHTCSKSNSLRIIAVHVNNRRLNHFGDVGTKFGRTGVRRVGGGKTDLVIDHNTNRAADFITPCIGHIQGFLHDTLTGNRGVTMHSDRQHFVMFGVLFTGLSCADRANHNRAHNFQVRRVKGKCQVYFFIVHSKIRGETLVIFHVTGAVIFSVFTGKFIKQVARAFTKHVNQHI